MSDSILTRPYLQSAELLTRPPLTVVLSAGVWTQVAPPDPQRMSLVVVPGDWSIALLVSPVPYGVAPFLGGGVVTTPPLIHAAVWPLLIGGAWWCLSTAGQTVTALDTIRLTGA